jgi:hypothetical protein
MSIVEQLKASGEELSPAVRAAIELLEATIAGFRNGCGS